MTRLETIKAIFDEGEWLTAEQLNAMQPKPLARKSLPASGWERRGRIFGVRLGGQEYFAKYQFDEYYKPLPIIKDILLRLGTVSDSWTIAAWFHFPNGWLSSAAGEPLASKDALDQRAAILRAAANREGSYVA